MDPELLRLLLEVLRNQNTTGSAATGGDWPYDDYGLQNTIGGLGQYDYSGPPVLSLGYGARPPLNSGATSGEQTIDPPNVFAVLNQAMAQRGSNPAPLAGLFGNYPSIEHSVSPEPTVTPVAAPVAGTAAPAPVGTRTPDPRRDVQTLPNRDDDAKQVRARVAPQQAARQIASQARTTRAPQRQYSTPPVRSDGGNGGRVIPPNFQYGGMPRPLVSASPARAAAQSILANARNAAKARKLF